MPAAVKDYCQNQSLKSVRNIQNQILSDYKNDFSKHVPKDILPKVNIVWESIPSQLAKENKKFIYRAIKKGARAKDVLVNNNAFTEYKGSFTEQYVLQELIPLNKKLYYYSKENSSLEIDFIMQKDQVYPHRSQGRRKTALKKPQSRSRSKSRHKNRPLFHGSLQKRRMAHPCSALSGT